MQTMPTKRILLVEDNPKDIELTLAALEHHRLAKGVVVARDGVEALDYLRCTGKFSEREHDMPALVLLDLKMPKMDGLEVLRAVKQDTSLKSVPIVVLTSSREERDILESYNVGVNAYVVKPVEFEGFLEVVRQLGLFWVVLNQPPDGSGGSRTN
ncbi:MAG: response regulator [Terriglobales bacterium]|jgi:CheY-like chemotaxis protein